MKKLSHVNQEGQVQMVDVTAKGETVREARATGQVRTKPGVLDLIGDGRITKGNVLGAAKIAGILAAKKTGELIPLCHPLQLTDVDIVLNIDHKKSAVTIESKVKSVGKTGVEMEALTAVSVAALTIYDMCKAADKEMVISDIMLIEKTGGKSGKFIRKNKSN
jgi:cyclic pyranopterin monophosphate synthase